MYPSGLREIDMVLYSLCMDGKRYFILIYYADYDEGNVKWTDRIDAFTSHIYYSKSIWFFSYTFQIYNICLSGTRHNGAVMTPNFVLALLTRQLPR